MSRPPTDQRDLASRGPTLAGTKVYDADGNHVGMVSNPTQQSNDLVVELGLLAMRLAYIPADAIARIDDTGVHLRLSQDDLKSGRYSTPPAADVVANAPTIVPEDAARRTSGAQQDAVAGQSPDAIPWTPPDDADTPVRERQV